MDVQTSAMRCASAIDHWKKKTSTEIKINRERERESFSFLMRRLSSFRDALRDGAETLDDLPGPSIRGPANRHANAANDAPHETFISSCVFLRFNRWEGAVLFPLHLYLMFADGDAWRRRRPTNFLDADQTRNPVKLGKSTFSHMQKQGKKTSGNRKTR